GTNTRLLPTAVSTATLHPSTRRCTSALCCATVANVKGGLAAERLLADEAMRLSCRTTRPGLGPAADLPLLLRQKTQPRKDDPGDGGPLRGLRTPLAPNSGSVRNALRSDSGRFFIRVRR